MGYTVFESKSTRMDTAAVTVQPTGSLRLNTAASTILREAGFESVLLMWDADKHKVALAPSPTGDPRAYKLRYHPKGSGAQLAAKAFIKYIGWSAQRSVTLPMQKARGMFEFELPTEYLGETAARVRKKKPEL